MKYSAFEFPSGWQWYLTHPFTFLHDVRNNIVWMFQRIFRGWDNRVTWGIDDYLNYMMPVWLQKMLEDKTGVPGMMFSEEDYDSENDCYKEGVLEKRDVEYHEIIQNIIAGFKANQAIHDIPITYRIEDGVRVFNREKYEREYAMLEAIFNKGMRLFKEYYNTLAD